MLILHWLSKDVFNKNKSKVSFDRISVRELHQHRSCNRCICFQRNMLSVKPVVHLIHYFKKKNVYQYFYVIIVVHVISSLVSRLVFKLKLANVLRHVRKQHKTSLSFFSSSLGYFFFLCGLGFDQFTFYLNKTTAWRKKNL